MALLKRKTKSKFDTGDLPDGIARCPDLLADERVKNAEALLAELKAELTKTEEQFHNTLERGSDQAIPKIDDAVKARLAGESYEIGKAVSLKDELRFKMQMLREAMKQQEFILKKTKLEVAKEIRQSIEPILQEVMAIHLEKFEELHQSIIALQKCWDHLGRMGLVGDRAFTSYSLTAIENVLLRGGATCPSGIPGFIETKKQQWHLGD